MHAGYQWQFTCFTWWTFANFQCHIRHMDSFTHNNVTLNWRGFVFGQNKTCVLLYSFIFLRYLQKSNHIFFFCLNTLCIFNKSEFHCSRWWMVPILKMRYTIRELFKIQHWTLPISQQHFWLGSIAEKKHENRQTRNDNGIQMGIGDGSRWLQVLNLKRHR